MSGRDRALVQAINGLFGILRINYGNQYLKCWPGDDELHAAKRLWHRHLRGFAPAVLEQAVHLVVYRSSWLPTVHDMVAACEEVRGTAAPPPRRAYMEACDAAYNLAVHQWSHPAVKEAGAVCGWHFLMSTAEAVAYPVFRDCYASEVRLLAVPAAPDADAGVPVLPVGDADE